MCDHRSDHESAVTLSNIVPAPRDWDTAPVHCVRCCEPLVPNHAGDFFSGPDNSWWVCGRCAARERPDLVPVLLQLRQSGPFTVTLGGPRIDEDAAAWDCPVCGHEHDEEPQDWHVVDAQHGHPVCADCLLDMDPAVVALRDQLIAMDGRSTLAATR